MIYRALNLWKKKFEKRSKNQQFIDMSLLFNGGKYKWGKETLEEVDCSGLISAVLKLMGHPIRTTANEFMIKFFTKITNFHYEEGKLKLVFFVSRDSYDSPSGTRLAGQARHVAILVGDGILFHAVSPTVRFETLASAEARYDTSNVVVREVDWDAIEKDDGKYAFDPELQ